jgi:hypothetical protein
MPTAPETTISITGCLKEISGRLTDAAAVAKAAVTCAESGSEHAAVRIVLELDEMLHGREHASERGHAPQAHAARQSRGAAARSRVDRRPGPTTSRSDPRRP